jgi:hypothetical protein
MEDEVVTVGMGEAREKRQYSLRETTDKIPLLSTQRLCVTQVCIGFEGNTHAFSIKIKEISMQSSFVQFPKLRAEMFGKKRMWGARNSQCRCPEC